jgi:hypothetical protein
MIDKTILLICLFFFQNIYPIIESPPLYRNPSTPIISRGSPRIFRVKRQLRTSQLSPPPPPRTSTPEQKIITKSIPVKDTTSRGTTPPPASFYRNFPTEQSVYYPSTYEMRSQQAPTTVRYRTPSPLIHPTTTTTSEVTLQQQPRTNATTTTKTSTRVLDPSAYPEYGDDSIIEETKTTTTVIRPLEVPAVVASSVTMVPQVTALVPAVGATTIRETPIYRTRRRRRPRTLSTLTYYTTSSTSSYSSGTITPPPVIKQHAILPPRPPIYTTIINEPPTAVIPVRRFIHHVRRTRTYSGYYSSDLDHGKRKVYKSDYKYRHYYYCNWCRGRYDLPNSSCGCCEWFYGCPLWALIILALLFLALIAAFFTLLGLQPTLNPTRRSDTAQNQILNRTQIIYGVLQNCGYQANIPTTLALCANTQTTSTAIIAVSSYIQSTGFKSLFHEKLLILVLCICSYFFVN